MVNQRTLILLRNAFIVSLYYLGMSTRQISNVMPNYSQVAKIINAQLPKNSKKHLENTGRKGVLNEF